MSATAAKTRSAGKAAGTRAASGAGRAAGREPVVLSNTPRMRQPAPGRQTGTQLTGRNYDSAAINRHNQNHFLYADGRDADSIIRLDLPTLRNFARYEIRNNCYATGITQTKANDVVGTGPRLQVRSDNVDFNGQCEELFADWCNRCDITGILSFGEMLRLAGSLQQDDSGESIIVLQNDNSTGRGDVSLRLHLVEPDRLQSPWNKGLVDSERLRDGIEFDDYGRPTRYYILKYHPGSAFTGLLMEYDAIPAEQVIHLYRMDRPGQTRGVPWIAPALPLFAYLRRYTLATVSAAETAANIAGQIYTDTPVENAADLSPMDIVDIERNALLTMPEGWRAEAFKSEQPSTTYDSFKNALLNEIARCMNMPFNVAAGNSSSYNYASGRLDWQVYFRFIQTVQGWIGRRICSRVFNSWLLEAWLIGLFGRKVSFETIAQAGRNHGWFWPGIEHVDPIKEAAAQQIRFENCTTTLAWEFSRQGKDWEDELKQIAREQKLMKELGIEPKSTNEKTKEVIAKDIKDEADKEKFTEDTTPKKRTAKRQVRA